MRTAKIYQQLPTRRFRPELTHCPTCQTRLRRWTTISQRTVITLDGPLHLVHRGYRCPNPACAAPPRLYRSARADALALPGFTFGLDLICWIGQLRLAQHQTLDETYQAVVQKLAPFQVTISRREVLYLFDAYCTLLRAAHQPATDPMWADWLLQVSVNGGIIVSLDGIQPDRGNETVYVVRDVLTGRILAVDNVRLSSAAVITTLLAPVAALELPVLGVISDAQESILQAVAALWPQVPHQVCHFHYLREAGRFMFDADRAVKVDIRKDMMLKTRVFRNQLEHHLAVMSETHATERAQLEILADYALGLQTALNQDGIQPYHYAGLGTYDACSEIATSLERLEKGGTRSASDVPPSSNA